MNHDHDNNEDHDSNDAEDYERVELPIIGNIRADDDSVGSGNNNNIDQMYREYQQETLFMQPISMENLMQHSNNDPDVTTEEEFWSRFNADLMMESFIAPLSNSYSDLGTFDWVPCSECGQCPCSWLKVRGAIQMFASNRWGDYLHIDHLSQQKRIKRCKILFVVTRRLKYGFPQYLDHSELESCIIKNIALFFQLSLQSTNAAQNI